MSEKDLQQLGTTLLFENETCRVWHLDLGPGEASDWHTHELPYAFVVTRAGPISTEYVDGSLDPQNDVRGTARYFEVGRHHRLLNTGESRYEDIVIEFKDIN